MMVLTGTKIAEPNARHPFSPGRAVSEYEHQGLPASPWLHGIRTAVQLAGLVLGGVGLLLGLAVIWTQLARALPLGTVIHHPRALRAMLLTGAGLGTLVLGRRGGGSR
jgi:hypothetical protein